MYSFNFFLVLLPGQGKDLWHAPCADLFYMKIIKHVIENVASRCHVTVV